MKELLYVFVAIVVIISLSFFITQILKESKKSIKTLNDMNKKADDLINKKRKGHASFSWLKNYLPGLPGFFNSICYFGRLILTHT